MKTIALMLLAAFASRMANGALSGLGKSSGVLEINQINQRRNHQ